MRKKQNIIRTGAIKFLTLFLLGIFIYFKVFFDSNMASLIKFGLEKFNGAQVDVLDFKSDFFQPSFSIKSIAMTDAKNPQRNVVELKNAKIELLADALLRAKLVINDIKITDISIDTRRPTPGKVFPKSATNTSKKIKDFTQSELKKIESKNKQNSIGLIAGLLKGDDVKNQADKIKSNLKTQQKVEQYKVEINTQKKQWKKSLAEIQKRIKKYNDFKLSKNINQALKQIKSSKKDYEETKKEIKKFKNEIKNYQHKADLLKADIKNDFDTLKQYSSFPKLNLEQEIKGLMKSYIMQEYGDILSKINYWHAKIPKEIKETVSKKMSSKKTPNENELKRKKAIAVSNTVYQYPKQGGHPLFWLKKMEVNLTKPDEFNLQSLVKHVSSSPDLIDQWPTAKIKMSGKALSSGQFYFDGKFKKDKKLYLTGNIGPEKNKNLKLVSTPDFTWQLTNSITTTNVNGVFEQNKFSLNLKKEIDAFETQISTNTKEADRLIGQAFNRVRPIELTAVFSGEYSSPSFSIKSNSPKKIGKSVKQTLKAHIGQEIKNKKNSAKKKIENQIASLDQDYQNEKAKILRKLKLKKIDFKKLGDDLLKKNLKKVDIKKDLKKLKDIDLKKSLKKLF